MKRNKKTFLLLYTIAFLMSYAYALTIYVHSSFLERYTDVKSVGLFITISTAFTLLAIYIFPQFIKKYTNFRMIVVVLIAYILSTACLVYSMNPLAGLLFFILHYVSITLLGINLDVFLEDITQASKAGKIRATYLTIVNSAILLGPLSMGYIVTSQNLYSRAYLWGTAIMVVVLLIVVAFRSKLNDHIQYRRRNMLEIFTTMRQNLNLLRVFYISFVLRAFFAVMTIYTPLYLNQELGFSWAQIGIVFTIMLTPFVLLELPIGTLADKYLGEKELIIIGLIIMAFTTGALFFIHTPSLIIWTVMLFMTRVGAALLEGSHEIYFFKIIQREDVDIINLFRDTHPAGWLITSAISVILLKFYTVSHIFLVLGIFLLISVIPALRLHDTK